MTTDAGGYDPAHFVTIAAAERRHFWFRSRNRVLEKVLTPVASSLPASARVLEIGCGTGSTLRMLERCFPGARVVGMDLFPEGLRYARTDTRAALVQARIEAHPFSARFNLIGMFDVLEHLEDDVAALRAVNDLLAPGGTLVMTVPADPRLWSAFDVASHHCRRYTRKTLLDALDRAGFSVQYSSAFMTAIYPMVWLSRRVRGSGESSSVDSELNPPRWFNTLMEAGSRPEQWILGLGGRLPFGTSLVALASPRAGSAR